MIESSSDRPEGKITLQSLTDAEIAAWWPIYDEPFRQLNIDNPCRQSFTEAEFTDAMRSPTMAKLAYIESGSIVSLVLLSNDLTHFPWLSQDFFRAKYPEEYNTGRIHYFVSFLTDPKVQGKDYGTRVLQLVTELFALEGQEQIITFDCCDLNASWMPDMIAAIPAQTGLGDLAFDNLGRQNYFAGRLTLT